MRTFEVSIPITGVVYFTVECESDDEDAVFEGNVTYAHTNDIDIEIAEVDSD